MSDLTEATGSQLARAATERDAQTLLRRWEALARAGTVLASSLDPQTTLGNVAALAVPLLADWCIVYVVDEDGAIRRLTLAHADPALEQLAQTVADRFDVVRDAEEGVARVIRTGRPIFRPEASAEMLAADVDDPEALTALLEPLGIRSWICVPLIARGEVLGAISLVSTRQGRLYERFDLTLAEELAAAAGLALGNARLHAETGAALEEERIARRTAESATELLATLQRLTAALARANTASEVADVVLAQGLEALGASAGSIYVVAADGGLEALGVRGYPSPTVAAYRRIEANAPIPLADALRRRHSIYLATVPERDRLYPALAGERIRGQSFAAVPLLLDDAVVGVLGLSFARPGPLDGASRAFVEALAEQCAQGLQRARLSETERKAREAAERARDFIQRLQRVTSALSGAVSPRGIADVVLHTALRALGASRGMLALVTPDRMLEGLGWVGFPEELVQRWNRFPVDADLPLSESVRSGRILLFDEPETWRRRYPALAMEPNDNGSVACFPLFGEGGPLGAMSLSFPGRRMFSDEEQLFMRSLGEQCGQALERARLYEAERDLRAETELRGDRLAFLAEASHVLSSTLDPDEALEQLAQLLVPRLADWCAVTLAGPGDEVRGLAVTHTDPEKARRARALQQRYIPRLDAPHGAGRVIRTGEAELHAIVADEMLVAAAEDEEHLAALRDLGLRSVMVVPLRARGRTLGAMTLVYGTSTRIYGPDDLTFAQELAMRAGLAVDNALLIREARQTEEALRIEQALLRSHMQATNEGTLIVKADGSVGGFNRRLEEMWGIPEGLLEGSDREAALQHVLDKLVDPAAFLAWRGSLYEYPSEVGQRDFELLDGRVYEAYSAPLWGDDETSYGRAWYFRDISDRKRTERLLSENRMRAQFLAETGAALASSMDHYEFLPPAAQAASAWMADWCAIDLLHEDQTVERVVVAHRDPARGYAGMASALRRVPLDPTAPQGVHRVLRTGVAEHGAAIPEGSLDREAGGNDAYGAFLRSLGLRSYICVPMLTPRGRVVGALSLVTEETGRPFGPADLAAAEELGMRAGAAVENALLYQQRSQVARVLQGSLLPPDLPEIPDVDLGSVYLAAGEAYEVGGDFYDVFLRGQDEWVAVMGDICGKGPDAAAATALARHTLRAAAMQVRRPSRVLEVLNEAMLRAESRFCTVAYVDLRLVGGGVRATVCCGGHPLPLIVRRDGQVEPAGVPGMLLGSFAAPLLTDHTVELEPGDALVMYTDGIIEARGEGGDFGERRLAAVLEQLSGADPQAIAEAVRDAVLSFQQGAPRDDIAVLVVKIR